MLLSSNAIYGDWLNRMGESLRNIAETGARPGASLPAQEVKVMETMRIYCSSYS